MKIQVSYINAEEKEAAAIVAAIQNIAPDAKIKRSDKNPDRKQIYITICEPMAGT